MSTSAPKPTPSSETLSLLMNPVRLRIVHAFTGGRTLTTAQLCAHLADVSKATMYRHVDVLADAGVLEVESEQRVRGAVERRYRLRRDRITVDAETAAAASAQNYRRGFAAAMAALLSEFDAYITKDGADPAADLVGIRQHALWLSRDELVELIGDLRAAILPRLSNEPAAGRSRHLLSPIMFPLEDPVVD